MIHIGSFALLRPWWLAMLAAIVAIGYLSLRKGAALGDWTAVVDPKLLNALSARGAIIPGSGRKRIAALLTAALIALALAGPAVRRVAQNGYRNLDATVIAVDLSRAAAKNGDLPEAKAAAAAIVQASGSRQIALIAYAGDAYLATPFTDDQDWLQTEISALDGQTIPDEGSHPARALSLARKILQRDHIVQANVILVSAGAGIDASAFQHARHLAASGYSVATIFTPPMKAAASSGDNSGETSLKRLAADGKGASANARNLEPVLRLAERAPPRLGRSEYALLIWRDLGPFLLLAALIPALFLFRRTR